MSEIDKLIAKVQHRGNAYLYEFNEIVKAFEAAKREKDIATCKIARLEREIERWRARSD